MTENLKIYTLGRFEVTKGNQVLTEKVSRRSKLWKLLQYLFTYRKRDVPYEELIEVLDLEDNSYPVGSLTALVYRLRKLLEDTDERNETEKSGNESGKKEGNGAEEGEKNGSSDEAGNRAENRAGNRAEDFTGKVEGGESQAIKEKQKQAQLILTRGNAYSFNQDADYWMDAEKFSSLCQKTKKLIKSGSRQAYDKYLQALDLYNGDYLDDLKSEEWIWSARNRYRDMLVSTLEQLDELMTGMEMYDELWQLYERAQELIRFDENLIKGSIEALLAAGNAGLARIKYEEAVSLYQENDLLLPPEIKGLRARLENRNKTDPDSYLRKIINHRPAEEAYVCDSETFTMLYDLEKRRSQRQDAPRYLVHLILDCRKSNIDENYDENYDGNYNGNYDENYKGNINKNNIDENEMLSKELEDKLNMKEAEKLKEELKEKLNDSPERKKEKITEKSREEAETITECSEFLLEILQHQLRRGDVICRWSNKHFILMLINLGNNDVKKVLERIENAFKTRANYSGTVELRGRLYQI